MPLRSAAGAGKARRGGAGGEEEKIERTELKETAGTQPAGSRPQCTALPHQQHWRAGPSAVAAGTAGAAGAPGLAPMPSSPPSSSPARKSSAGREAGRQGGSELSAREAGPRLWQLAQATMARQHSWRRHVKPSNQQLPRPGSHHRLASAETAEGAAQLAWLLCCRTVLSSTATAHTPAASLSSESASDSISSPSSPPFFPRFLRRRAAASCTACRL